MDSVWLCREGIPGLAAGLDNCFGVVEHAEGKEALVSSCQPAPSRTMAAWTSSGRIAAKRARNRSMTLALTLGSTRVKSSPVAGQTAVKMSAHW